MLAEPTTATPLPDIALTTQLTPREREVLSLLAQGLHYSDVAEVLVLSPATVNAYAAQIREKLGARNTPHAVFVAFVLLKSSSSVG